MSEIKTAERCVLDNIVWNDKGQAVLDIEKCLIELSQFKEVKPKDGVRVDELRNDFVRYVWDSGKMSADSIFNWFIPHLSLSTPSKESDAVEFAEWVNKHCYKNHNTNKKWDFRLGSAYFPNDIPRERTTTELYNLFKQSKTK